MNCKLWLNPKLKELPADTFWWDVPRDIPVERDYNEDSIADSGRTVPLQDILDSMPDWATVAIIDCNGIVTLASRIPDVREFYYKDAPPSRSFRWYVPTYEVEKGAEPLKFLETGVINDYSQFGRGEVVIFTRDRYTAQRDWWRQRRLRELAMVASDASIQEI